MHLPLPVPANARHRRAAGWLALLLLAVGSGAPAGLRAASSPAVDSLLSKLPDPGGWTKSPLESALKDPDHDHARPGPAAGHRVAAKRRRQPRVATRADPDGEIPRQTRPANPARPARPGAPALPGGGIVVPHRHRQQGHGRRRLDGPRPGPGGREPARRGRGIPAQGGRLAADADPRVAVARQRRGPARPLRRRRGCREPRHPAQARVGHRLGGAGLL